MDTAHEKGLAAVSNGDLIQLAAEQGYDVLITADQNIQHQQNTSQISIGIVVLLSNRWPLVRNHTPAIIQAVHAVRPGEIIRVPITPRQ